jgi:uncharacterized protein (TIGR02444 family)
MTEDFVEASDGGALWRFSVAFYARPGVSEALIALQDRAGVDVNLMLFALWRGVSGGGRLSSEELAIADRIARPLRVDVVEPLRALRRKLRKHPDTDVQRLREGIKAIELATEQVVQNRLSVLARPLAGDPAEPALAALANLRLYLGPELAGSAEADTVAQALQAFLAE